MIVVPVCMDCRMPTPHDSPCTMEKKLWTLGHIKKAQYRKILLTLVQFSHANICSCCGAEMRFPFQPESMVMTLNILNQIWHAQSFVWKIPLIFLAISCFLKGIFGFIASHSKLLAMAGVSPACLSAETGGANDCIPGGETSLIQAETAGEQCSEELALKCVYMCL